MKNKYKMLFGLCVVIFVCVITLGYAVFGTELSISNIVSEIKINSDIRITGLVYSSSDNNGMSISENYDVDSVVAEVTLPNNSFSVTYKIEVTNFGNQEIGIYSISGLPNNLTYKITDYDLQDKICDESGNCVLGAVKNFYLTIEYYAGGYDSTNTTYDLKLDFDFRKMHVVTYEGITNNDYPTFIINGAI